MDFYHWAGRLRDAKKKKKKTRWSASELSTGSHEQVFGSNNADSRTVLDSYKNI